MMEDSNNLGGKSDLLRENYYCKYSRKILQRYYYSRAISRLTRISLASLVISIFLIPSGHCSTTGNDVRLRAIHQKNFGCENLGELPPMSELRSRSQMPQCGCGYWGKRMFDKDPPEEPVKNVTVTTERGKEIRFECKQCRLCMGLKVASQCKPKQDTLCSEECENPCYEFSSFFRKCLPSRTRCQQKTTTATPAPSTEPVSVTTAPRGKLNGTHSSDAEWSTVQPGRANSSKKDNLEVDSEGEIVLHPWLVAATIVIAVSIVAVLGIIIYVVRTRHHIEIVTSSSTTIDSMTPCLKTPPENV